MTAALQNRRNFTEGARGSLLENPHFRPMLTYTDLSVLQSGKFHCDGGRNVTEGHLSVGRRREIGGARTHAAQPPEHHKYVEQERTAARLQEHHRHTKTQNTTTRSSAKCLRHVIGFSVRTQNPRDPFPHTRCDLCGLRCTLCVNAIAIHLCRAACEDGFIGLFCLVIETHVTQGRLRIMSEATEDRKSSIFIINYETVLIVIPPIASSLFLTAPAVAISSTPPVSAFLIFVSECGTNVALLH